MDIAVLRANPPAKLGKKAEGVRQGTSTAKAPADFYLGSYLRWSRAVSLDKDGKIATVIAMMEDARGAN
jgi:hypothetical protein